MQKLFGSAVKPSAEFGEDIEDSVFCARVYNKFEEHHLQRENDAKQKAIGILKAVENK